MALLGSFLGPVWKGRKLMGEQSPVIPLGVASCSGYTFTLAYVYWSEPSAWARLKLTGR